MSGLLPNTFQTPNVYVDRLSLIVKGFDHADG